MSIKPHLKNYTRDSYINKGDEMRNKYHISPENEIDCDLGTSSFGQSPSVRKAIEGFDLDRSVHYFQPFHDDIKEVILSKFKCADLKPENIFFGHGTFNLAERIIHKFIQPTAMLGYGPQFNEVTTEMAIAGGRYKPVQMDHSTFLFPEKEIISELTQGEYSIGYLDNPNNPTGQSIPLSSLERIISLAEKKGTLVLVDEAYGDYLEDSDSAFNLVKNYKNLMVIRSLSKGMGLASFRFGYAAFSTALVETYKKIDVPFEPSLICAVAGKAALEDNQFIEDVRRKSLESKAVLIKGLSELGLRILPTHPNVSIFVANSEGEKDFYDRLASLGIITEAGESYKLVYPEFDNSFVRIRVPKPTNGKTSLELSHDVIRRLSQ